MLVVQHTRPYGRSYLPSILARTSNLPVAQAAQGEPIVPGRIYIAPPDQHLLIEGERVRLAKGPRGCSTTARPGSGVSRIAAAWQWCRTLTQLKDGRPLRFRCHTGHAFTANSLLATLTDSIEETLWSTAREIEESTMLMRHMGVVTYRVFRDLKHSIQFP